jgi:hypothetical protein
MKDFSLLANETFEVTPEEKTMFKEYFNVLKIKLI